MYYPTTAFKTEQFNKYCPRDFELSVMTSSSGGYETKSWSWSWSGEDITKNGGKLYQNTVSKKTDSGGKRSDRDRECEETRTSNSTPVFLKHLIFSRAKIHTLTHSPHSRANHQWTETWPIFLRRCQSRERVWTWAKVMTATCTNAVCFTFRYTRLCSSFVTWRQKKSFWNIEYFYIFHL